MTHSSRRSDDDVENPNEESPMLGDRFDGDISTPNSKKPKGLFRLFNFFGGGIYAPDSSTYDPIEVLLNARDPEERDRLTEKWASSKLAELNFVGIVASLLTGVQASTASWTDVLTNDGNTPWAARTCWYCGILLSLCSILSAADQTVRLHRLVSHRDSWKNIRTLLSKTSHGHPRKSKRTGRLQPYTAQVYTWQLSVMFLTTGTIFLIVGMFLHVWAAIQPLKHVEWSDPNLKVAVVFTIVASISFIVFFAGQVTLYSTDDEGHDLD